MGELNLLDNGLWEICFSAWEMLGFAEEVLTVAVVHRIDITTTVAESGNA